MLIAKWVPGTKHIADLFTKNLSTPQFEQFPKVFVKEDEYTPKPEYGGCYSLPETVLNGLEFSQ